MQNLKVNTRIITNEFKAEVALEAIQGKLKMSELVKKYGINSIQINAWKMEFLKNKAKVFESGINEKEESSDISSEVFLERISRLRLDKIAIFGAGGFGKEVACIIKMINKVSLKWDLVGFYDDGLEVGTENKYGSVLGGIEALNEVKEPLNVVIATANPSSIKNISALINNPYLNFPNIIAPNVIFFDEESVSMGKGNVISLGCRISTDVSIGDFNVMNGAVSLGHDVNVGSFNSFGPSVRISGNCEVGNQNFFGINSLVLQGNKIGHKTRVGAGSVVMRPTKDNELYVGNPAVMVKL